MKVQGDKFNLSIYVNALEGEEMGSTDELRTIRHENIHDGLL